MTLFYNESDKTPVFNQDYSVEILDEEKRIYGIEAQAQLQLTEHWTLGALVNRNWGQREDTQSNDWIALSAFEVSPPKVVAYVEYQQARWQSRLQSLTVGGYNEAHDDDPSEADIQGYTLWDASISYQLPSSELQLSINNLFNKDYQTVYSQWAGNIYGSPSGIPAQGRTMTLSYRIDY